MDWLDKTLHEYEEKEKNRKVEADEAEKRFVAELENKRQQATSALENINKTFSEIKEKLKRRKYPCDSKLGVYTNAQTGKQYYNEAMLIVRKKPLAYGTDLSKTNSPYISFSECQGSDFLCLEINITENLQPPNQENVPIKRITSDFVKEQVETFIKNVFM